MDLDIVLNTAKKLAREAGKIILEIYNSDDHGVSHKENSSLLTAADTAANKIIMEGLRSEFPQCGLLSEEDEDDHTRLALDYVFIVDPLDGTAHFVKRDGDFSVNIALVHKGIPVLGVIYAPVKDQLYHAVAAKGSFLEQQDQITSLKVSSNSIISQSTLVTGHGAAKRIAGLSDHPFAEHKLVGSSLKGCLVASNEADAYLRFSNINEWDICAMHIIVQEAGGIMTDSTGKPLWYNKENTRFTGGFIASNAMLHPQLIAVHSQILLEGRNL